MELKELMMKSTAEDGGDWHRKRRRRKGKDWSLVMLVMAERLVIRKHGIEEVEMVNWVRFV